MNRYCCSVYRIKSKNIEFIKKCWKIIVCTGMIIGNTRNSPVLFASKNSELSWFKVLLFRACCFRVMALELKKLA